MTTQPRVHMVGNAHLDPAWLWRWPEGCAEAIGTCWAAVELLAGHPGMIFTRGEAVVYRWIEELDPALFARITRLVLEGRWVIVNGWWLQPDCNLPDGEAFLRQSLYGKRYFRDRFGVEVTIGYNVDSFGHAATLPMLLRHTGFTHYVFMRPMEHEHPLPASLFAWRAPDGSTLPTYRIPLNYETPAGSPPALAAKVATVQALALAEGTPLMCFFGVGNHGGGPTREDLAQIAQLQQAGHDVVLSDPARYFAEVGGLPRPLVADELQRHAIGCYAAVSALKRLNRQAEAGLAQAEAASTLALLHAGAPYPHAALHRAWETLLFNQFHDILGGTCIPSATRDAEQALGAVIQDAEQLTTWAIRRLAATVAPAPDPRDATFLVFNLSGTARHTALEYEPWTGWNAAPLRLLDEAGQEVPYQDIPPENYTRASLHRMVFVPEVPAFGYRLYRFVQGAAPAAQPATVHAAAHVLDSSRWRLEIDPATGGIASLVDRQAGRPLFAGPAHLPVVVEDPSDTWSHGLDRFGLAGQGFVCEQTDIVETGPIRVALRVRSRCGASSVTSTYLVYADPALPVEIRVSVDWHGRHQLLRFGYPLALAAPAFRYEIPYGSLERADDGREYPGQRWVLAVGEDRYGVAVANDAKYSYAAHAGVLYLTALRSPVFAHHDPYTLDPAGTYPYSDQGEQQFTLRLLGGPGMRPATAHRLADDLLRPLLATPHVGRTGTAPHRAGLLAVCTESSSVTWLKAAEEGEGAILRVVEHDGEAGTVEIGPGGERHTVPAYGILTLRSDARGVWRTCSGLEE